METSFHGLFGLLLCFVSIHRLPNGICASSRASQKQADVLNPCGYECQYADADAAIPAVA